MALHKKLCEGDLRRLGFKVPVKAKTWIWAGGRAVPPMYGRSPERLAGCLAPGVGQHKALEKHQVVYMAFWANTLACLIARAYNFHLFLC